MSNRIHRRTLRYDHMGEEHPVTQCGIELDTQESKNIRYTVGTRSVTCKKCRGRYIKERRARLQRDLEALNRVIEQWENDKTGLNSKAPKNKGK